MIPSIARERKRKSKEFMLPASLDDVCIYIYIYIYILLLNSLFNGISTFVGYLVSVLVLFIQKWM